MGMGMGLERSCFPRDEEEQPRSQAERPLGRSAVPMSPGPSRGKGGPAVGVPGALGEKLAAGIGHVGNERGKVWEKRPWESKGKFRF